MNLFDLSPRELTNSAVWMWLLSGLTMPEENVRRKIAKGLLTDLNVPVPDTLQLLKTEYSLPDGRRIDIFLQGQALGQPYIFFIENKVSGDAGIDQQVRGYIDALKDRGVPVYSAVFSLYPGIRSQIEQSQLFDAETRPQVVDTDRMINLLGQFELHEDGIPAEFLRHLIGHKDKAIRVRTAIQKSGADPETWLDVAKRNGVSDLFAEYVDCASVFEVGSQGCLFVEYFTGRSVAVLAKPKRPLISLHPMRSMVNKGLWVGFNDTNWRANFGKAFPQSVLPKDFEKVPDSKQPNWEFGYLESAEEIQQFFSAFEAVV